MNKQNSALRISFVFIVLVLSLVSVVAQAKININGKPFYTYNVKAGETLYSISKYFSVSVEDILVHNPNAKDGLQSGQVLNIPVTNANNALRAKPQEPQSPRRTSTQVYDNQNNTFKHTVQRGETVYGIANMYNSTVEELFRYNPSAQEGINVGDVLIVPQRKTISSEKEKNYRYHTIQPKETLYGLSRTYKMTPENIMEANPGLSAETFQIGKIIRIPFFESNESFTPYEQQVRMITHTVVSRETLSSIARKYNVAVEDIQEANPMVSNGVRPDMKLNIPIKVSSEENNYAQQSRAEELLRKTVSDNSLSVIRVALLLPFLDNTSQMDYRLQEYYEGLLLAIREMKQKGANIELYVFEIGKNSDTQKLESLLGTSEMKQQNLIIGGVSDAQIKAISTFSKANKIKYVIPLSSRNNEVLNNNQIFQVNSPQSYIYAEASGAFTQLAAGANVLFLNVAGKSDKSEFISVLQKDLKRKKIAFSTIEVDANLAQSLQTGLLAGTKNVIIPTSGDKAALRQIIDAVKKVKRTSPDVLINMCGYPEWQTYGKSFESEYHRIGTYIYASFFVDENDTATQNFERNFNTWYKRKLLNTYPKYGILGYDTGMYFLTALYRFGDNFDRKINQVNVPPIQFLLKFERVNNWGGFINDGLLLINYDVNGAVRKSVIE